MLRRTCLRTLGAAAFSALAAPEAVIPLKDIAARHGIRYGSTDEINGQTADPAYLDLFARHCALLAPNLSSRSVWKADGTHDFSRFRAVLNFAREHGIQLTGAHLLWHETAPGFLTELPVREDARRMAGEHIEHMCATFAGQAYSWNAVNEAIDPRSKRADGLRETPLLKALGDDFIDFAFHTARAADPHTLLVYNDYDMEMDRPDHETRRRTLLRLLDGWKKRNVPVDAIGLQTHIKLRTFQFQPELYRRFLSEVAARGVQIFLTELDVLDIGAPSDIAERDSAVGDAYRRVLEVALDEKAVTTVVTWGLSDRYTWLRPGYSPNFARADGLAGRPLPFDAEYRAKPAYHAIAAALARR